jgi:hypothetical protein
VDSRVFSFRCMQRVFVYKGYVVVMHSKCSVVKHWPLYSDYEIFSLD